MATVTFAVGTADTGALPNISGSFSPALNDLLVVFVVQSATVGSGATLTSTIGGFTFTQVASKLGPGDSIYAFIADQLVSDTSSQAVNTDDDAGDAASGSIIFVFRVSGMTKVGLAALLQAASNNDVATTTPRVTFPANTIATNPIVGVVGNSTSPAGVDPPGGGWTEPAGGDIGYSTPLTGSEAIYIDSGYTAVGITWASGSASAWRALALELDASAPPSFISEFNKPILQAVNRASTY